jgi:hypothetical protein
MIIIGPVVVIVAIVIAVYLYHKKQNKEDFQSESRSNIGEGEMSTTRQVWFYIVTLITLVIFAVGVGQLLTLIFDVTIKGSYLTQVGVTNFNKQQLSLGLAMTVIGGPLWFLFWRAVQRRIKGNQEEIGSEIRKLFLNFILIETAIMGITAASNFLKWLMAGVPVAEFSSNVLAFMIVGGIVWFYHWRISESEGHPSPAARTFRRWYVYILSGFGLVWLSVGLVLLINTAVINLPVWENTLVRGQFWDNTAQMSIAQLLLGGITWYFHWFRMARDDFDSMLRQVYYYLLTISGGAIAALVALTIILFRFFIWVFGGATISISPHFQFLGWAIPTVLISLAIWGYHRRLVQEEAKRVQEKRQSAQRVYFYLMSFLGLGALVAGLSWLFGILIDLIINAAGTSLMVTTGWWREQLALCLALLLIGAPLWLYYWNGILKRVRAGGIEEWRALSRRIFLYVIVGVSIIILAADLVNIIYQLLSGILQGNFGVEVLRNSKWSLQTLIVAAPLLWYHWRILRTEQRRGAEIAIVRRNVTLLVEDRKEELASRLESKLGFKIHLLFYAGQTGEELSALPDEEIDRLANEIQSSPSNKILIVALSGKITVLPYQDK